MEKSIKPTGHTDCRTNVVSADGDDVLRHLQK